MKLVTVWWTIDCNMLGVECDCGTRIAWPSRISTVMCFDCGRQELWHDVYPPGKPGEIFSLPVMRNCLTA
jgi:hypothetical protein